MSTSMLEARGSGAKGTQPDLGEFLARIDARLARLEQTLAPVAALGQDAPKLLATLTDVIDEKIERIGDIEARMSAASDVIERLSRPQTLSSLRKLVDLAENAPGLVATFTDVFDEVMAHAAADGLALSEVFENLKRLSFGLLKLTASPELRALVDSHMLDPRALMALGQVAQALVQVRSHEPPRVGMLGALRALGNQDVQRALGFLLEVAAGFGRSLRTAPADANEPPRLTAG